MKPNPKPVGLSQIVKATGFSRTTVFKALRSLPKVGKETADFIRKTARELGYTPDARMIPIMAGVRASKTRELLPLAWLNNTKEERQWRDSKALTPYLEGALRQCHSMGYTLDELWLNAPGMTARRMSKILYHRGIRGIVLPPGGRGDFGTLHLNFDWRQFCWVSMEGALLAPRIHKVVPAHHYNLMLALKRLRRCGYRRIGLFLMRMQERRSQHHYLAALKYFQSGIPREECVSPHIHKGALVPGWPGTLAYEEWLASERKKPNGGAHAKPREVLGKWIKRERPDVIVGLHSELIYWLTGLGLRVPEDIGVAHLALDDDCADWAGIWENKRYIGAQAVRELVAMIHTNQPGIPDVAHETLIRGTWRLGWTVRNIRGPKASARRASIRQRHEPDA